MKTNTTSLRATLRSLRRLPGCALALAALGLLAQPAAQAGKYFDTDGVTAGFQATDGATYTTSDLVWNPNSNGIGTLEIITPSGGTVIGNAASDFSGYHITLDIAPSPGNGVAGFNNAGFFINSNNLTFTLTNSYVGGIGNFYNMGSPWAIAAGSTVNVNAAYNYNPGMNWGSAVTFQGGGTINFNTMLGFNSNLNQTCAGSVINLKAAGATVSGYTGGFTLTSGTLNFAAAPSATAFQMFPSGKPFAINGGILDNTSGSPMTLTVGAGGYRIGGNFTFPGSSDLNFGTAPVALTGTRQITVSDKTLTIGGIISGSGFGLTKTGDGTLILNGASTYDGDTLVSAGAFGGTGTLAGAATFETGSKAVFTVTPGGTIGNNSSVMKITGVMTYNANEVHLNLPPNLAGGDYVLAYSDATPVANGTFPTPVVDSGSFHGSVTGATITLDPVTKHLILTAASTFMGPVQLAITQVNGGANPTAGTPFDVVVQAQNGSGIATPVLDNTEVTLTLKTGNGSLNTPLIGTIIAGQDQVTISGVIYPKAEGGVVLEATRTSGDDLTPGLCAAFTVNPAAVSATASTVTASLGGVPADGTTPITITVTLWDDFNNPIPGKTVTLASDRGAPTDTIAPDSGTSNANGVVTFTLTSATPGPANLSATVDPGGANLLISEAPVVVFTTPVPTWVIGEKQFNVGPFDTTPSPIGVVSGDMLEMPGVLVTGELWPWTDWQRNGLFKDPGEAYSNDPFVTTYAFNLTTNPLGYDIKEIRMFTNPVPERGGQSYDILYSLAGAPDTFILLGSVLTPANEYGALMTRTYDSRAGATPDAGPAILSGVAKIRFNFRTVDAYGVIWREIDVTGVGTGTHSISGTVTAGGSGLSGVTVSDGTRTATTATDGTYTITGVPDGTYTVTPSMSGGGYAFTPTNSSAMVSGANVTGVDFTAAGINLVIGEKQFNTGPFETTTPSPIGVVSGDLLEMPGIVATGGGGFSQPESWMRNGVFKDPDQLYTNNPLVMTYALNLATNPLGYSIKEIRMFSNPYQYRGGQEYDILYSTIAAPDTFILLGTVLTPKTEWGVLMTRTYDNSAGTTPDAGPAILSGVAKIRFNFRTVDEYGTIWREFDVTGTPTPVGTEVSTTTLARSEGTGTTSNIGELLSFDVTVSGESGTPTGNVTLKDNCHGGTTFGSGTLADGACTITTTTLGAGPHNDIVAVYSGNLTYAVSTSSALVPDQVVNPGSSTVTVTGPTSFIYTGAPQGPSTAYKTGSSGLVTYEYVGVDPTTYDSSATPPTAIGTYSCTATLAADDNYAGAVSEPFAFAIVAGNPPSNDNYADAIALTGDSGTQTGTNNIDATFEAGEPTCLYPSTTNTVWFKWTCTTSGNFTLRTLGSTTPSAGEWDSVVGIYTGSSLTELTALPSTPQDNGGSETVTVAVTAGTTYYIQLAGWSGVWDGITYPPDVAANILLTWSFVGGGGGYGSWADTNHVTGGPNGDSDNDGISNLVEYALLLDPAAADGSPGSFDGSLLSFTKRDVAVTNDDVTYAIEISTTLAADSWTEVLSYVENNSDTISCTLPTDVGGKVFARLVVTQQP